MFVAGLSGTMIGLRLLPSPGPVRGVDLELDSWLAGTLCRLVEPGLGSWISYSEMCFRQYGQVSCSFSQCLMQSS